MSSPSAGQPGLDGGLETCDGVNGVSRLLGHAAQRVRQARLVECPQLAQRHAAKVDKVCRDVLSSIGQ